MELYRGGMAMHELVVCLDERPSSTREIGREPERVPVPVPIRNPGLTIVQEGLAAGVSARLNWDAHHYPEISALVDPLQGALFNAVDGVSTVAEIATSLGASSTDAGTAPNPLPSKLLV